MIFLIRLIAAGSLSVPVGSPETGSFSIIPNSGFGVSAVIPANSSALEFAQPEWPSSPSRYIGISKLTASKRDLFALPAGNNPRLYPAPTTQPVL